MRLRTFGPALLAGALALAGVLLSSSGGAGYDPSLRVESHAVYSLRPDQGRLHVALQIAVTRPSPTAAAADRIDVPVVVGAANLRATTDAGAALDVQTPPIVGGPFTRVDVLFGRTLTEGERIAFTLDYDLREIALPSVYVGGDGIYAPVLTTGDPATIELDLPDDSQWYSLVMPDECERDGAVAEQRFTCTGSADGYVAAVVQLINQAGYRVLEGTVQTTAGAQPFELRYQAGHEAWASRVRELATAGVPVLESIVGVPLELREEFSLIEVEPLDLGGYDGIFQCIEEESCRIGVVSETSDGVVLHELAHLWTTELDRRWLAEGLAEFAARHAARQLGIAVDPAFSAPDAGPVYLDEWGSSLLSTDATEDAVLKELAGYRESVRLLDDIEARIGLDPMRSAIALAGAFETADSQAFLDLFEATSGADLTDLFRERVFPPSLSSVLDLRAKAKTELAQLIIDAAETEFELHPDTINAAIQDWTFSVALDAIDDAYAFMEAYPAALEAKEQVSAWGRLGLIGKNPKGALEEALQQFNDGDFDRAARLATSAEHDYVTASQSARDRALVALAVIVMAGVLIAGGTWALRGNKS